MSDINNVTIVGRLTRDAELRYTNSGTAIASLSAAVNRRKKTAKGWEDEANFFDVTLWGKTAESLSQYLTKGKQIAVQGELVQSRWEQDGQSRSKVGISAINVQLLGGQKSEPSKPSTGGYRSEPQQQEQPFDSDIPF